MAENDKSANNKMASKVNDVENDKKKKSEFLYTVSQRPPFQMIILLSFQQALLSLSGSLAISTFAADAVCAGDHADIRATLLSSTLFMNGVTTLFMVTLGIRLPLYQGAAALYIVPLLALQTVNKERCSQTGINLANSSINHSSLWNGTANSLGDSSDDREFIYTKIRELGGCLILAGFVHCAIGTTGLVGFAMRAIGPVTVVPTLLLTGIYLCRASTRFSKTHWGISLATAAMAVVLSIYLRRRKMPIPVWSRSKGFHVIRYPLQQVYAILIAMLFGWMIAGILTKTGALPDNPADLQYKARTDARIQVLKQANWFTIPYPGQFGAPSFSGGIFAAFIVATLVSILDSIGDYYACARMCNVPPPPRHGVNRGIAIEGICTALSGTVGVGHGTSTVGGNIGAIGVTRVASRDVFLGVAVVYILFGIIGKFSAVFITMPYPVLGGGMIIMYGMYLGISLSNLAVLSLSSTRNLAIIGMSMLLGLMIPYWIETTPDVTLTGRDRTYNLVLYLEQDGEPSPSVRLTGKKSVDDVLKVLLANPTIPGGIMSCFLDNTAPGSKEERGIKAWQYEDSSYDVTSQYDEGPEVYYPLLPKKWFSYRLMKYIPIFPYITNVPSKNDKESLVNELQNTRL